MNTAKKAASAASGKTARACDGCLRRRARWYCAADDAFLCQACDSSVHSANQLASRHERVRLESASSGSTIADNNEPAWLQGFTRKARTPRHTKPVVQPSPEAEAVVVERIFNPLPALVPEIGSEEASPDENEEQLLYQVPVFDPFAAELCDVPNKVVEDRDETAIGVESDHVIYNEGCDNLSNLHGFLPSDMDLAEFAADVESLLGTGLENDSCGIEGLGLLDCKEEEEEEEEGEAATTAIDTLLEDKKVKVEDEHAEGMVAWQLDSAMDMDWNLGYESAGVTGKDEMVTETATATTTTRLNVDCTDGVERKIFLRLDYEAVIAAWASQGSPWTTGSRPEFKPSDCWPDFLGSCPSGFSQFCMGFGGGGGHLRCGDGGREARVSRYREKRRTRLFSKKIRYEVRKLNAEKRPRMKGRFVKRTTSSAGPTFPNYLS